ncbi:hypothetical protein ARMGADRAFT_1030128 [Armillaria gallica]|uniref:CMP/dCMP-type deaminase domain-containing protein n=1 Tax=Armillaria gallica TaxID=47427 RepID=A0A2H3DE54_ARMGA|nr:hypothetical protein ARMGADRAFT_1030128 [Armillaria gallica]
MPTQMKSTISTSNKALMHSSSMLCWLQMLKFQGMEFRDREAGIWIHMLVVSCSAAQPSPDSVMNNDFEAQQQRDSKYDHHIPANSQGDMDNDNFVHKDDSSQSQHEGDDEHNHFVFKSPQDGAICINLQSVIQGQVMQQEECLKDQTYSGQSNLGSTLALLIFKGISCHHEDVCYSWENEALAMAQETPNTSKVLIGCIFVHDGIIIAKARNQTMRVS